MKPKDGVKRLPIEESCRQMREVMNFYIDAMLKGFPGPPDARERMKQKLAVAFFMGIYSAGRAIEDVPDGIDVQEVGDCLKASSSKILDDDYDIGLRALEVPPDPSSN